MKSEACAHCVCAICEDVGCVECALCRGRRRTDSCQEAFITPRRKKKKKKESASSTDVKGKRTASCI